MKLMVIDGNSIVNRAFYGVHMLTTRDGQPTNAVYGFLTILQKLVEEEKPDALCCTFDRKAPTFRHLAYEGYKAQRKGMPDEAQFASSQKQNRGLSCTLRFVILLLNLNGPVNRALDDRQKFFRAEFQLVADPLPQCAFLPHDLRVKILFHGKPADFDKLYDNRQAGNCAVIFDVGKIAPVDIDLFRQRLTR